MQEVCEIFSVDTEPWISRSMTKILKPNLTSVNPPLGRKLLLM